MRRIFAEYLDGKGDRAIANGLNLDGIPCPSARRPEQNRHRLADGWRGSTTRSILENPRYTGYATCSLHPCTGCVFMRRTIAPPNDEAPACCLGPRPGAAPVGCTLVKWRA
ncbi:recombinase family protein [Amycolatopsis sp. WAC 01416]|uniref:recombinase family protein n=1 Tax=Amycolatopsis sp. WAC 01416 TaxID=2203196 RepID=UPI001F2F9ECB|nr:recombinase family protein [Amycolatopsis sp. WAC 01416]